MFKYFIRFLVAASALICVGSMLAGDRADKNTKRSKESLRVTGVAVGPTNEMVESAKLRATRSDAVQREIGKDKFRLISLEFIDNGAPSPMRFRVVFYDYSSDRTLVAEGDFAGTEPITTHDEAFLPYPNDEEFQDAVRSVKADPELGDAVKTGSLRTFQPMPPMTVLDGTIERLVNVGLDAGSGKESNEVVSVSMTTGKVIRYDSAAPPTSRAAPDACGVTPSGQSASGRGVAGQAQITVMTAGPNPVMLWEMLITRPSASSGTNASGIELQNVKYKGKLVFKKAHVPVLDVQYVAGAGCGPYRDWEYSEDPFQAPATGATDVAPGVRILATGQLASTELDSGNDTGNFQGVAIYTQDNGVGPETVLVTELQAGWYRYIMEWRFAADGTIRPRYGFGATSNNCVCSTHTHHAYWRFDFDIVNSNNKVFEVERGRKYLTPLLTETFLNKNIQTNRSLLIQNATGDEAYELVPNPTDGTVDAFGAHDFWVLRYKTPTGNAVTSEYDDGRTCCGGANQGINIDSWVNGESIDGQDVVVWYGTHFIHSDQAGVIDPDRYSPNILSGDHVVGPNLRPVRW